MSWEKLRADAATPAELPSEGWAQATVPGRLDGDGWWLRTTLTTDRPRTLGFDGLATVVDVWLDGACVLQARNAFRRHRIAVPAGTSTLHLAFRPLDLGGRRPRPRWKSALVASQNLRWVRTPLYGHIPAWTPPEPVVGPYRGVGWVDEGPVLRHGVDEHGAWVAVDGAPPGAALHVGDRVVPAGERVAIDVVRWSPEHPVRHACRLVGAGVDLDLGRRGFRHLVVDEGPVFVLNGRRLFCRGAVLTRVDPDPAETVRLAKAAGVNLLRVGGTSVPASDGLLDACDEAGLLLWQDLPYANLDYPFDDPDFHAEAVAELDDLLARFAPHACVAALCGGSEIEQQAAMLGLPREAWVAPFFAETARARVEPLPWFTSTPTGGPVPFSTSVGLTHYYGVGAYLRPLTDVRAAAVRFTPECLGFSNVPEGDLPRPHSPAWKAGVPRDAGAGWDFEDVRDHYHRVLFGEDPVALRSTDLGRYWQRARFVTGELMARAYAEWRRPGSGCGGALVWTWQDLVPGGGWGVVDADGRPKPAWWFLRRAWAPRTVLVTDEGLDGVAAHVHNELDTPLDGTLEVELWRGRTRMDHATTPLTLAARSARTLPLWDVFGRFVDLGYTYRFGPPAHDVGVVRLIAGGQTWEDAWYPQGWRLPMQPSSVLHATRDGDTVVLEAETFLQGVSFHSPGHVPDDAWFPLPPGRPRRVRFTPEPGAKALRVYVQALNLDGEVGVSG